GVLHALPARCGADGHPAPSQGAWHLRAPAPSRRQAEVPGGRVALPALSRRGPAAVPGAGAAGRGARSARAPRAGGRRRPKRRCIVKALIFAAGRGERMRPLTDTTPKPLLEVGGKPLIAWHLDKLAAAGVRDVVVNTSWLAPRFPELLGNGARWGM